MECIPMTNRFRYYSLIPEQEHSGTNRKKYFYRYLFGHVNQRHLNVVAVQRNMFFSLDTGVNRKKFLNLYVFVCFMNQCLLSVVLVHRNMISSYLLT